MSSGQFYDAAFRLGVWAFGRLGGWRGNWPKDLFPNRVAAISKMIEQWDTTLRQDMHYYDCGRIKLKLKGWSPMHYRTPAFVT